MTNNKTTQLTLEDAKQKFACIYCEAESADECICDDLNFADTYCECGCHNEI